MPGFIANWRGKGDGLVKLGAWAMDGATSFAVRAPLADEVVLCLFDGDAERRVPMRRSGELWSALLPQDLTGMAYGYRASGEWAPARGLWFDPAKLLVDPYAIELDRRFQYDANLSAYGFDTSVICPKALVQPALPEVRLEQPRFAPGGLIYELNVKGFTKLHPQVPDYMRGTVAALAHPAIIAHLQKLKVSAVELMPVAAWIDERHLPPLGLANAWGYNPVALMALDPDLCPGGVAELRDTVAALHRAGIGVILDIVLNHTGESDVHGPVLCLRGLDNDVYAHDSGASLVNVTGCGNTLDFGNAAVRALALETLRHFVRSCGVDGFRFDLAPVLGRGPDFCDDAPFFADIAADPLLQTRVMIAEPWDIGHGGYRLGQFPQGWLEWNDRFRDDVRQFWRGDGSAAQLATRLAGSADIFGGAGAAPLPSRSVNFLAAHDGFTLADTVSFAHRHNHANGEDNRDGHGGEISWNNGAEGRTDSPEVLARRVADIRAMLGTLFASTGTIMLTAGDEFGRTQRGNNNAYCQDNAIGWLDWKGRDLGLEDYVEALSAARADRVDDLIRFAQDGRWFSLNGQEMTTEEWENPAISGFRFAAPDGSEIEINRPARLAMRRPAP